jgi:hypothetical protein
MRTTLTDAKAPRLLVSLFKKDKLALTEKEIITNTGEKVRFCIKAYDNYDVDRWELSLKVGKVIGLSEGCHGYRVGDIVFLDYVVDADEKYFVSEDDEEKVVSVPCHTTYHDRAIWAHSYGRMEFDNKTQRPIGWKAHGEKNTLVADIGDVEELSLVLAVIRGDKLIPNDYYLFCEYVPDQSTDLVELADGIIGYRHNDEKVIKRKVLFCSKGGPVSADDTVMAKLDSNIEVTILEKKYDVIPIIDVLGVLEQ